jgi:hypothetical protein
LPAHAQSAPDTLWQKAVVIAGRNLRWVPGLIVTRTEEVDDDGRVKNSQESWIRMRPGDGGEPVSAIEKLIKNGKDETARAQRDEAEQKAREQETKRRAPDAPAAKGAPLRFGGPTPFDPGEQDSVSYHRIDPAAPDSAGAIVYEFAERLFEGVTVRGTTRLTAGTGVPLEMRFTTDPLPKRVKDLAVLVRFAVDSTGAWWPAEMSIRATGKLLLFTKRFHTAMSFREYWWRAAG